MSRKYKKYDDRIKEMVITSGNPSAFPELGIPRTTALYWIKNANKKIKLKEVSLNTALSKKIELLEKELLKERAKNLFLNKLLTDLNGMKDVLNSKKNKTIIVKTLMKFSRWLSVEKLCKLINLRISKYYNYKVEVMGCERIGFKKCKIQSGNQLSFKEQEIIYEIVNNKKLNHLSIKRLQYYAFRKGLLTCGYDTWRKYTKLFAKDRNTKIKRRTNSRTGIRASSPNEIWHMDITEFKLIDGKKVYLQVIIDNYSRKVLSWELSSNKAQSLSIKTIETRSTNKTPLKIMVDAGGENLGLQLKEVLKQMSITRIIAKRDTSFSNSMVESFFYTLKNRYIDKSKTYKLSKIYNLVRRSVNDYNKSPTPIFYGATPNEMYSNSVCIHTLKNDFTKGAKTANRTRIVENKLCLNKLIC